MADIGKLGAPFPPEQVKYRVGPGGKQLDYVAIETVLQRLLDLAPGYNWQGRLVSFENGTAIVEGTLSIDDKNAYGIGAMKNSDTDMAVKSANSEAIKNAAKNGWGMALELWTEEGREVVARGRAMSQGDLSAFKQEVFRLGLARGAEPTAESIAAEFDVSAEQLSDVEILKGIIDRYAGETA